MNRKKRKKSVTSAAKERIKKIVPIPEKGDALLEHVIKLTGIPSQIIRKELHTILERKNIDTQHLTLEQLRTVVASYLREIMGTVLAKYSTRRPTHEN